VELQELNHKHQVKTLQNVLEFSSQLFPFRVDLDFTRYVEDDDNYNYSSPLNNPYLNRFSKKRIQDLLGSIKKLPGKSLPKGFRIISESGHLGFECDNFNFLNQIKDANLLQFYELVSNGYFPLVSIEFYRDTTSITDENATGDKNLQSKVKGTILLNKNVYSIAYFPRRNCFKYQFVLDTFANYGNKRIKSIYSIVNGYMRITIGNPNSECYMLDSAILVRSGSGYDAVNYEVEPDNKYRDLNIQPLGNFIVRGKKFLAAESAH
jgi:hypothetical protein